MMFSTQIALYVKKCSYKYGNDCFTKFNQNTIIQIFECYHSSSMGKFVYFAYGFKIPILNFSDTSFDNFDSNNIKI
jgi:hypothetical protein